jgi:two-component system response regulator YesN
VLGVTFRDYLLKVRLERAKVLLAAGHVSITEVAYDVGYGDLARFDKVFKRYTGLTPSAYRSSNLRGQLRLQKATSRRRCRCPVKMSL